MRDSPSVISPPCATFPLTLAHWRVMPATQVCAEALFDVGDEDAFHNYDSVDLRRHPQCADQGRAEGAYRTLQRSAHRAGLRSGVQGSQQGGRIMGSTSGDPVTRALMECIRSCVIGARWAVTKPYGRRHDRRRGVQSAELRVRGPVGCDPPGSPKHAGRRVPRDVARGPLRESQ